MAETLSNPHDRFFRQSLARQEVATDFLQHYLPPEVAEQIDLSSVHSQADTFIDEGLRAHYSDLLFVVRLKDNRPAAVYVLFEHKSYPDVNVAFQLLRYMVRIWERWPKASGGLEPIIPLVVYHGQPAWRIPRNLAGMYDGPSDLLGYFPDFRYWLVDLTSFSDADIKGEAILRLALLAMKHIHDEAGLEHAPAIFELMEQLSMTESTAEFVALVLRYLVTGSSTITEVNLRAALEQQWPEGVTMMSTIAENWIQQGIQQGRRQGMLDAIDLGLKLRFGSAGLRLLPEIRRIDDLELLRAVYEGIETVESPQDLQSIYQ
ncbi:MAG: Rpn family recombination-promoting nuclease/putative transposase [Anaerolineae bacterium]|nr:Rpn family recombination-promoting nuclease/putative transposase [Anaerolineae bacterium]